jgi:hypothetical protein
VVKVSETANEVLVRFEVSDTGIGLSEEAQRELFQPFYKVARRPASTAAPDWVSSARDSAKNCRDWYPKRRRAAFAAQKLWLRKKSYDAGQVQGTAVTMIIAAAWIRACGAFNDGTTRIRAPGSDFCINSLAP